MQKKVKTVQALTRILVLFLWIALMVLIYWFSDQPDTVSSEQSMRIGKLICSILVGGYDTLSEVTRNQYAELIDHFVRKSAHFCEYAVLGMLTWGSFCSVRAVFKERGRRCAETCSEAESGSRCPETRSKAESGSRCFGIYSKIELRAWAWCICYAATDEFHQLFVPGRYGMVRDVILDSLGALTGITVCILVSRRFCKNGTKGREGKREDNKRE